mmetsp:Transcript_30074/g.68950  ORF Transcript_30074/g.68950 Transcript_30074/m.68950 type:complete len:498 (-) Transcript_30074:29-1522(-)
MIERKGRKAAQKSSKDDIKRNNPTKAKRPVNRIRYAQARACILVITSLLICSTFLQSYEKQKIKVLKLRDNSEHHIVASPASSTNKKLDVSNNINIGTNKPYFIFHVGPPKTGTTTVQCGLQDVAENLARLDSYYYLGKPCIYIRETREIGNNEIPLRGHEIFNELFYRVRRSTTMGTPNTKKFQKRLRHHNALGNHLIFSVERFFGIKDNEENWKIMENLFEDWDVRIVLAYRHYFDWIPSLYYQRNKNNYLWKQSPTPSFHSFMDEALDKLNFEKQNMASTHPTIAALRKYSKHFKVQLFDIHNEKDITKNFVCEVLPSAKNVCKKLQLQAEKKEISPPRKYPEKINYSRSLDARLLFEAAYLENIIKIGKNPQQLQVKGFVKEFSRWLEGQNQQKYSHCLSYEGRNRLLKASLQFEEEVQKFIPSEGWESKHVQLFNETVKNKKFCQLDPKLVFESAEWETFALEFNTKWEMILKNTIPPQTQKILFRGNYTFH